MALTGTLEDVGLDELFTLIQQQLRTGRLILDLPDGTVSIDFREGVIAQVDDDRRPAHYLLGELLVASQLVDRIELAAALESQRANQHPLGTILVANGVLKNADLHRYLDLQYRETLYPLLESKVGRFEFDPEGFRPRTLAPPSLLPEDVLLDGARWMDEWDLVGARIDPEHTRVRRVPGASTNSLSDEERRALSAVWGRTSAQQLVGRLGVSSFEACKFLIALLDAQVVEWVDTGSSTAVSGALPQAARARSRRGAAWLEVGAQVLVGFGLALGILLLAALRIPAEPGRASGATEAVTARHSPWRDMVTQAQLRHLSRVIEAYRLEQGDYPASLNALVEADRVTLADLTRPDYQEPYYYRRTVRDIILLPPKR